MVVRIRDNPCYAESFSLRALLPLQNNTFAGRVRIVMDIDRQTRTLKVQGVLNGTVRRANGTVRPVINDQTFFADADLTTSCWYFAQTYRAARC